MPISIGFVHELKNHKPIVCCVSVIFQGCARCARPTVNSQCLATGFNIALTQEERQTVHTAGVCWQQIRKFSLPRKKVDYSWI